MWLYGNDLVSPCFALSLNFLLQRQLVDDLAIFDCACVFKTQTRVEGTSRLIFRHEADVNGVTIGLLPEDVDGLLHDGASVALALMIAVYHQANDPIAGRLRFCIEAVHDEADQIFPIVSSAGEQIVWFEHRLDDRVVVGRDETSLALVYIQFDDLAP